MSRILKVSQSDYRVKVQDGGTITLDSGVNTPVIPNNWIGGVVITGDLLVMGETTTVNTTNLNIEDNIIRLNVGETGSGITEGTSGIEVDRGILPNARIVFDESVDHFNPVTSSNISGTWVLELNTGERTGLQLSTLVAPPGNTDLVFDMQDSTSVLRLENTTDYSSRVTDDNDIPNRRWVTDYVESGTLVPGQADTDRYYNGTVNPSTGQVTLNSMGVALNSLNAPSLEFYIRNSGDTEPSLRAKIINTGLYVDGVQTFGSTIQQHNGIDNLILTAANNNVELNAVLNLDDQLSHPGSVIGATRLYSRAQQTPKLNQYPGKTGLFFTNEVNSDELVSKNRALLFSMLF